MLQIVCVFYITSFSHLLLLTHQFIPILFIFLLDMTQQLEIASHFNYVSYNDSSI